MAIRQSVRQNVGRIRRIIVAALNVLCTWVDSVAYRPVVVRFGGPLPHRWDCNLARMSIRLDDRWRTGYWDGTLLSPGVPCEACHRRPALVIMGGYADDPDIAEPVEPGDEDFFFAHRTVHLCLWCYPDSDAPPANESELRQMLDEAGRRSTGWRWRWSPDL